VSLPRSPVANEIDRSLRAELSRLVRVENTALASSYNEALRDAIAIVDRHEQLRKKRSAHAIARRKAEGKKIGGDLPYGYAVGPDNETLVENPEEQRVMAAARKLRGAGNSLRVVARKLMERRMLSREGTEFHAAQIKRMTDEDEAQ